MTGEVAADDDHRPPFDADRPRKAGVMLTVQAWRSSNTQLRDEFSALASRIRLVIDQYDQRRSTAVRSVDAANYLERLRRKLAAMAHCKSRQLPNRRRIRRPRGYARPTRHLAASYGVQGWIEAKHVAAS